jgi:hypothetical protein
VVTDTRISINIAQQTRTAIQIDKVNGVSVCAAEARADIEKLQLAFETHPNIFRNFGPVLASVTALDGSKRRASADDLQAQGVIDGCKAIYVSIHQ